MNNFIKIIVFILMYFSSPCAAFGDGLVLGYFERDWRMVDEKSQLCFIGHSGDTENILLAVNFDDRSGAGKVAWIFPVPSSPESVEIDIIKEFPETVGASLEVMYNKKLDAIFQNVLLTQVITLPVFFFRPMMMAVNSPGADLKVYKSIASMGVVTQLVSAKDQAALKNYIEAKGLKFPENLLKVFEKYTRLGYCFVISWIDDFEKFKRENEKAGSGSFKSSIGVFAAFPSREIYFPLTPTSAYNEKIVPLVLYIMGHHVEPNFYDRIKPYSKCDLEISEKYRVPEKLSRFFFGNKYFEKLDFSVISINAPSSLLVEDLKISPRRSAKSKLFGFISEKGAWVSVVLIVIFSCLASLFAGRVAFGGFSPSKTGFFLFGFFNLLSFSCVIAASYLLRIDRRFSSYTAGPEKIKKGAIAWAVILNLFYVPMIYCIISFHYGLLKDYSIGRSFLDEMIVSNYYFSLMFIMAAMLVYLNFIIYMGFTSGRDRLVIYNFLFTIFFWIMAVAANMAFKLVYYHSGIFG